MFEQIVYRAFLFREPGLKVFILKTKQKQLVNGV